MTGEDLYPRLEPLLAQIGHIQYVGGELNSQVKPWDAAAVHWALMYPDAYEVGLPNQGLMILYEVLNERPDALAERTYVRLARPRRPDARERRPPVHRRRPRRRDFDLLGVSFAAELGYTNLLEALDLAGVPILAADRDETPPVVVAGGHAAFNPEPVSDFVDCAVLGDGKQAVGDITDVVKAWKAQGSPGGREGGSSPGWPGWTASTSRASTPCPPRPGQRDRRGHPHPGRRAGQGRQAHRHGPRRVALPEDAAGAARGSVHERMSVEIFRGCTRGCRFCQAGMITAPCASGRSHPASARWSSRASRRPATRRSAC